MQLVETFVIATDMADPANNQQSSFVSTLPIDVNRAPSLEAALIPCGIFISLNECVSMQCVTQYSIVESATKKNYSNEQDYRE